MLTNARGRRVVRPAAGRPSPHKDRARGRERSSEIRAWAKQRGYKVSRAWPDSGADHLGVRTQPTRDCASRARRCPAVGQFSVEPLELRPAGPVAGPVPFLPTAIRAVPIA